MTDTNIILATDSYKLNHWAQYPKDTEVVYSYLEARKGAKYPETVFFGLQYILKHYLEGAVIDRPMIDQAQHLAEAHFGNPDMFNFDGWMHIMTEHDGKLPVRIKAVPEGMAVPEGNVLMTVENTCPKCFWLTNAIESLLTHVWYPSTVASLSRDVKKTIKAFLDETAESDEGLPFMLHDFGYRGASSHESAGIGGLGHLINFVGTDTLPAMLMGMEYYDAKLENLAFSVSATEHSVMTARGEPGEMDVVDQLIDEYPIGILSVVADSYNIYDFVSRIGFDFGERIMARDGVFVVRPDSTTDTHKTPAALVEWIATELWAHFNGEVNRKGYKVLDSHVRILWGDGIGPDGIADILRTLERAGFSAENMVFGMGGGLLQKINRDTQRFAFKASAIKREDGWHDVQKKPLDATKTSKAGKLRLIQEMDGSLKTVPLEYDVQDDILRVVFENGELKNEVTFDQVRANAEGKVKTNA